MNPYRYDGDSSTSSSNEYSDMHGVTQRDMVDFVGDDRAEYYLDKWGKYQESNKFISWNWSAFFFGIIWFIYRKMYGVVGVIFGAFLLSNIFTLVILKFDRLESLTSLVVMIGSGLFANQLYIKNCIKNITEIKNATTNISKDDLSKILRAKGGVSW